MNLSWGFNNMAIIQSKKPLKPRAKLDFYPTPIGEVYKILHKFFEHYPINLTEQTRALDAGAGEGTWGYVWNKAFIPSTKFTGVELSEKRADTYRETYHEWVIQSYLDFENEEGYDFIIGNPPFNLAQPFIHKSLSLLKDENSKLLFLLPMNFLHGQRRFKSLWAVHQPEYVFFLPNRISWTGDGGTNDQTYCIPVWGKNSSPITKADWINLYV